MRATGSQLLAPGMNGCFGKFRSCGTFQWLPLDYLFSSTITLGCYR